MAEEQIPGQMSIDEQLALRAWASAAAAAPVVLPLIVANMPPAHPIPAPGLRLFQPVSGT